MNFKSFENQVSCLTFNSVAFLNVSTSALPNCTLEAEAATALKNLTTAINHMVDSPEQGSTLQKVVSVENFSNKFSSSNLGQISTLKQQL
jgi:hypothetical protein